MERYQILKAIERRMELPPEEADAGQDWKEIESWLRADPTRLKDLVNKIAEPLIEIIRCRLLPSEMKLEDRSVTSQRWTVLNGMLKNPDDLPLGTGKAAAAVYIEAGLRAESARTIPLRQRPQTLETYALDEESVPQIAPSADAVSKQTQYAEVAAPSADEMEEITVSSAKDSLNDQTAANIIMKEESESIDGAPTNEATTNNATTGDVATDDVATTQEDSSPSSQSSRWRYLPVPDDPDQHTEFDARTDMSPEGLKIIAARARGKKHKHEGTNCDDWFEFGVSGKWTVIAVSDGAGSKIFSRIGAKDSCETALRELSAALLNHELKARKDWSGDKEGKKGIFAEEDLRVVREALHNAMQKAYDVVAAKAQELVGSEAHKKVLGGREVVLDDLSGTLLLAVHTTVTHEDIERSFVMTCQIGDGMLAVVDGNGGLKLMGIADSGEFAGQTDFLTSKKKLEPASLASRTFGFFGPLKALMVMSDGVADDYFPNDPGMLRLYGDLAINGILQLHYDPKTTKVSELIGSSLKRTALVDTSGVMAAQLASPVDAITADGPQPVMIRSVETYAEKLGIEVEEVVKSTPLLMAGAMRIPGEDMCSDSQTTSEEMLRVWIDSYHVRGSFDDRTLVVLYQEVAS